MHSLVVFLLFLGMILIIHGVYEQKLKNVESNVRVEYRFIPRTYYEEQMGSPDLSHKMKGMFDGEII
jgi:hypothetical protein